MQYFYDGSVENVEKCTNGWCDVCLSRNVFQLSWDTLSLNQSCAFISAWWLSSSIFFPYREVVKSLHTFSNVILNGILILKDFHHKYTRVFVSFLIRQEICICFLIFSRTLPVDDARWINFWQNSVFYLHYAFKWEKWLFIFRLGLIRVRTSHRTDTQVQTWWCQVPLFGWTKLLQPRFVANKRKHEFEHGKLWKILIKIMCHYWLKKHCKRLEHILKTLIVLARTCHTTHRLITNFMMLVQ